MIISYSYRISWLDKHMLSRWIKFFVSDSNPIPLPYKVVLKLAKFYWVSSLPRFFIQWSMVWFWWTTDRPPNRGVAGMRWMGIKIKPKTRHTTMVFDSKNQWISLNAGRCPKKIQHTIRSVYRPWWYTNNKKKNGTPSKGREFKNTHRKRIKRTLLFLRWWWWSE